MCDSQKAFLYRIVASNITGNWFHSAVGGNLLDIDKKMGVYSRHRSNTSWSGIVGFKYIKTLTYDSDFHPKQYCVNVNKLCLRTGRMQDTPHAPFYKSDCDFYMYYTLVL